MNTSFLLRIILLSSSCILCAVNVVSECQSGSTIANISLATKTPYRFVANRDDSAPTYEGKLKFLFLNYEALMKNCSNSLLFTGCNAVKFWAMIRHGTRNPGDDIISNMKERLPIIRDEIVKNHQEDKGITFQLP